MSLSIPASASLDAVSGLQATPAEPTRPTPARSRLRRRLALTAQGLAVLALTVIVAAAILAPYIAPYAPNAIDLTGKLAPPSAAHLLGADHLGRDVLSRLLVGARISLFIAACSVLLAGVAGSALGVVAGYAGGLADAAAMRLVDMQLALPSIILALVLAGAVGVTVPSLIIVLSLANWAKFARVMRGETIALRTRDFVLLARLSGASAARVVVRHIAPGLVGSFVVLATLDVGSVILLETSLSFLGLGVPPPAPSWGSMIADGRSLLDRAWWISGMPGLALFATVLSVNLIGDALADKLNPKLADAA